MNYVKSFENAERNVMCPLYLAEAAPETPPAGAAVGEGMAARESDEDFWDDMFTDGSYDEGEAAPR